jgi:hypothetical protein
MFNRKPKLTEAQTRSYHFLTGSEFIDYPEWARRYQPITPSLN